MKININDLSANKNIWDEYLIGIYILEDCYFYSGHFINNLPVYTDGYCTKIYYDKEWKIKEQGDIRILDKENIHKFLPEIVYDDYYWYENNFMLYDSILNFSFVLKKWNKKNHKMFYKKGREFILNFFMCAIYILSYEMIYNILINLRHIDTLKNDYRYEWYKQKEKKKILI